MSQPNPPETVTVTGAENGERLDDRFMLLHDASGALTLADVLPRFLQGQGLTAIPNGSTGLQPGAFWAYFQLQNTQDLPLTLNIEYVDHQLIQLQAFASTDNGQIFEQVADLSLDRPFAHRTIPHNRFVFSVPLKAGEQRAVLVKMGSKGKGYVFPNLRLWSDANLQKATVVESGLVAFLAGGVLLMAVLAVIAGISAQENYFYTYAVYCVSKIAAWATIFGFTHQWLLTDNFHWSYMSMSGAVSIFCGLLFTRQFLNTRLTTPRWDKLLKLMMVNAVVLFVAAIFETKTVAILSITLALLLYPVNSIVGLIRWRQGSKEAGVFALAWGFLMAGLVIQAMRDLGYVSHNFINYYWPAVASYTEVVVILAAMGMSMRRVRAEKDRIEKRYTDYLESSKLELEDRVMQRTKELVEAKRLAEYEARTDDLTGTRNRRSFFADSQSLLRHAAQHQQTYSLLMFDIDNFKDINDRFGHAVGDRALCHFTEIILGNIRDGDVFGRLGGEEFSLLLRDSKENAMLMAQRLLTAVSDLSIETESGTLNFTTSIGVAHLTSEAEIE